MSHLEELFPEHFPKRPDDYGELLREAVVVLDTNVLLRIERLRGESRADAVAAVRKVADQLFFPHQVMHEYLRNRETVAGEVEKMLTRVTGAVKGATTGVESAFAAYPRLEPHAARIRQILGTTLGDLLAAVEQVRGEVLSEVEEDDEVLELISELSADRVGARPSPETLRARREQFHNYRVPHRVPPGYDDVGKEQGDPAGDFLIWSEILEMAAGSDASVLFVTEDRTDDWWEGPKGKRTGPRRELIGEFASQSSGEYRQVGLNRFLDLAKEHLGAEVHEGTVLKIEELAEEARLNEEAREEMWNSLAGNLTVRRFIDEIGPSIYRNVFPTINVPIPKNLATFSVVPPALREQAARLTSAHMEPFQKSLEQLREQTTKSLARDVRRSMGWADTDPADSEDEDPGDGEKGRY